MWTKVANGYLPPNDNQDLKSNEESHQPDDVNLDLSNEQIKVDQISNCKVTLSRYSNNG